jgi:hypothetical protein
MLRRWITATALVVCASVLFGRAAAATSTPHVLEAQRFVLKDTVNRERAILGLGTDGLARLTFFPQDGSKGTTVSEKPGLSPAQ